MLRVFVEEEKEKQIVSTSALQGYDLFRSLAQHRSWELCLLAMLALKKCQPLPWETPTHRPEASEMSRNICWNIACLQNWEMDSIFETLNFSSAAQSLAILLYIVNFCSHGMLSSKNVPTVKSSSTTCRPFLLVMDLRSTLTEKTLTNTS